MPHDHHDPLLRGRFQSKEGRSIVRIYAKPRQDLPSGSDAYDSSSKHRCVKCQPVAVLGRAAHREPFHPGGEPHLVQQNIIHQNINILLDTQGVQRRGSRPTILILNGNQDANQVHEKDHEHWRRHEHCTDKYDPAKACPLCARDQQSPAQSRHVDNNQIHYRASLEGDEIYKLETAVKNAFQAREVRRRKQQKFDEAQVRKSDFMQEQLGKNFGHKSEPNYASSKVPRNWSLTLALREGRDLDMAADEIQRELEQCNADLKQCRERAARKAQSQGRRDEGKVLEQEELYRREALKYDWAANKATDKATKKELRSILIKKKVRFLS